MAMASLMVLRRASTSPSMAKLLRSVRPFAARPFNTNSDHQRRYYEEDELDKELRDMFSQLNSTRSSVDPVPSTDESGIETNRHHDVFGSFNPNSCLSEVSNEADQFISAKEDESVLYLTFYIPGFRKEDVELSVEGNTLRVKVDGEGKGSKEQKKAKKYSNSIEFLPKLFKLDQIKAQMKNGVLKAIVPKVNEEDEGVSFEDYHGVVIIT